MNAIPPEQATLDFSAAIDPVTPEKLAQRRRHVAVLEALLAARTQQPWMTRREIAAHVLAAHGLVWTEREVRILAGMSDAIASAPGSPGYAYAALLPWETLMHLGQAKKSQARVMFRSGVKLTQVALLKKKTAELLAPAAPSTAAPIETDALADREIAQMLSAYFTGEENA